VIPLATPMGMRPRGQ